LDGILFASAAWAGDFLGFVKDDFLEMGLAIVADVFVDRHRIAPLNSIRL
jgi:hypothetical protein